MEMCGYLRFSITIENVNVFCTLAKANENLYFAFQHLPVLYRSMRFWYFKSCFTYKPKFSNGGKIVKGGKIAYDAH